MKHAITRVEAEAFKRRWAVVNAAEEEELRSTPLAAKLLQTAALMESAKQLRWDPRDSEEEAVRLRWLRLREILSD